ncbi:MAG: anti-sigma factor antagonist [Acidobacteriota bacterium]|jgi:anti-sigma B factor antagonist
MLKVHAKKLNTVEVLCLEGQIVASDTEILRNLVQIASGTSRVILDLSSVSVVDAHGLGVLLQLREQTLARGAQFQLMNVSRTLYRVFEITRLNTVFEINSRVEFFPQFAYAQRVLAAA